MSTYPTQINNNYRGKIFQEFYLTDLTKPHVPTRPNLGRLFKKNVVT